MKDCQKRGHRKLFITCEECHQVINQATFKAPDEWINVKDRMPKIREFPRNEVLVSDGIEVYATLVCFDQEKPYFFKREGIKHWMPMPEPSK